MSGCDFRRNRVKMQQQLLSFLPIIIVFVLFYFMLLRPQRKREKERMMMLQSLKRGDKVITIGGLHGTIVDLNEKRVTLKVNDHSRLVFERSAVNQVINKEEKKKEKEKEKEKKKD